MTNPTWRGVEIDPAELEEFGWYVDTITVDGVSYKRLIGYQVAGLSEMAQYMAAAGGALPTIRYGWDTTTTDADPGAGDLRANHATLSSVTFLYASKTDDGGATVTSVLDQIDMSGSTVKALLRIAHRTDPTKWVQYTVGAAITDATGYVKIPVTYVAGSGSFSADDEIALGFLIVGDIGATGPSGNNKVCEGGTAGGTANAPTITCSPAFTGTRGEVISFLTGGSTSSNTVSITADDVTQAARFNGAAFSASVTLPANSRVSFQSDGTLLHQIASTGAATETGSGLVKLATQAETNTGTDDSRVVTPLKLEARLAGTAIRQGKHTIGILAGGMLPATTNGCAALAQAETTTNKINYKYLAFDPASVEYAWFAFPSPKSYNASTMTFRVVWAHPSTTTNFGVVWQLQILALADDDAIDTALGTAVTVSKTGGTTQDFYRTSESTAVTPGNTAGKGDWMFCRIGRLVSDGSDTLAVDAHLIGVEIYYTVDASTDA